MSTGPVAANGAARSLLTKLAAALAMAALGLAVLACLLLLASVLVKSLFLVLGAADHASGLLKALLPYTTAIFLVVFVFLAFVFGFVSKMVLLPKVPWLWRLRYTAFGSLRRPRCSEPN